MPKELLDRQFQESAAFFAQPLQDKLKLQVSWAAKLLAVLKRPSSLRRGHCKGLLAIETASCAWCITGMLSTGGFQQPGLSPAGPGHSEEPLQTGDLLHVTCR